VKRPSIIIAIILGVVGFVTSFGAHIVAVNLPVYAEQVGVGLATIGLLIAAYDFAEIIAKPIFGAVADRQGMKTTMLVGIGLFILASLLFLFIDPRFLLLVRFLQGIGAAALSAVSLALVGVYFKKRRGQAYGIYNAIKGSGYVISPVVGGALLLNNNFSAIFIAAALFGMLAFVLSLALPNPKRSVELDDDDFSLKAFAAVFREPKLLPWYTVTVVNMFFVGILFGFLPVRVYSLGYDTFTTGSILSLVALSYLLIQPVAGILADRTNTAATIRAGLLMSAASIILLAFATGAFLIVLCVISGIGVGIVWTNTDALISGIARKGRLGATMGAAGSFKELGDMVGPLLIGLLSQALGLSIGFVICGILGLLALPLISRVSSTRQKAAQ
jgi:MFS family permease